MDKKDLGKNIMNTLLGKPVKELEEHSVLNAYWEEGDRGVVVLNEDFLPINALPIVLDESTGKSVKTLERAPTYVYSQHSGYYGTESEWVFTLYPQMAQFFELKKKKVYLAGSFNDWSKAVGKMDWLMEEEKIGGVKCLVKRIPKNVLAKYDKFDFKFVTEDHEWFPVPNWVYNISVSQDGNKNYHFNQKITGLNIFYFTLDQKMCWQSSQHLILKSNPSSKGNRIMISYEECLLRLNTELSLGATASKSGTIFRLFAPRATRVTVVFFDNFKNPIEHQIELKLSDNGIWEGLYEYNLHGYYYYYRVDGPKTAQKSMFDYNFKILDPYAKATVSREGPGIIIDDNHLIKPIKQYEPPSWHDLIILEVHVRDIIKNITFLSSHKGFVGLTEYIKSEGNYLKDLGINCVELLPVAEFDVKNEMDYHWGYMTSNFFAPCSAYALEPTEASQIDEFRQLVEAFHDNGLSVILDVVYNHVGEPAHLMYVDKLYYFECKQNGMLENWSGCGNDFRANTPMGKRLIIDSLVHWVKIYDVDGFRFDLAELLGVDVLVEIETALKAIKPSIILIAEPWSFRGHIGYSLKSTGFSSWNDGYREFMRSYVLGQNNVEGLKYYLKGSLDHLTRFPSQTVNYVESHDDFTWIDRITQNPNHNGYSPTLMDIKRTHLMIALMMMSLGIPMLAQGQESLRSKKGIFNTYQNGLLNALDYNRKFLYPATYRYFKSWIKFRLSHLGRYLRLDKAPHPDYFKFYTSNQGASLVVLFNSNYTLGNERLLFSINPYEMWVTVSLDNLKMDNFKQIADADIFELNGLAKESFPYKNSVLELPPLSCGLWIQRPT